MLRKSADPRRVVAWTATVRIREAISPTVSHAVTPVSLTDSVAINRKEFSKNADAQMAIA